MALTNEELLKEFPNLLVVYTGEYERDKGGAVFKTQENLEKLVSEFPQDTQGVIRVLLKHEDDLSDGYEFYAGDVDDWNTTKKTLIDIAREIAKAK